MARCSHQQAHHCGADATAIFACYSTQKPIPMRLIGPSLRSLFYIDEFTFRAWSFGLPRVDLHP
jgi:hypothetical protein